MPEAIDRRRLVRRHNPVLTSAHPADVLTVGNGDIALTVDVSGLQTFPSFHELVPDPHRVVRDGLTGLPEQRPRVFDADDFQIPLRTQSTWGWYETRADRELRLEDATTLYETSRGPVPYLDRMGLQRAGDPIAEEFVTGAWYHFNPRRAHLGRLALVRPDGTGPGHPAALSDVRTELDLWTGTIHAAYVLDGEPVRVTTVADPHDHRFAVRVESGLLLRGWGVAWVFDDQPDDLAAFELPLAQKTTWDRRAEHHWNARRTVETLTYGVSVSTTGSLRQAADSVVAHANTAVLEVVVTLAPDRQQDERGFSAVRDSARAWWAEHWSTGAAISLAGSTDARAGELERRIVLSQYLTAVNSAGATPPAESGLTYNTWTGKFHLEMHWWHAAHFSLWGRGHLLERSLRWYHGALDAGKVTARRQGCRGARWPKQTDPSARESPSNIGVFLLWQQPHVIYLLELLRGEGRGEAFLREHYPLVEATADFMADFAEERDGSYELPPPLIPAQESYLLDRATNADPTFELAYWSWALRVANDWRVELGLEANQEWDRVARNMRRPTVLPDGTYAAIATPPLLIRKDHPSMLMALGWLPETHLVDPATMSATLDSVWEHWDLQSTWGWDYPVMAMTAARLGDTSRAIDALLLPSPKNVFLPNGHNPQIPGFLTVYLPANGGLLAAMAHLATAVNQGAELPDGWLITAEGLPALPHPSVMPHP
ncbi:hypothetical protein [Nonomuraea gerenzanensis]|uniref:Polygalacturonase n=1 Tax=Nonomuraea gerenzanensis TaxID=93944 RepID=A0A1M4E5Y0_9ACTN|nr:hypothetical protein [Nonomuraea gerenzanensis]UBU16425.1 hypothetical protein LCN96_15840 [Nonomuraea gerenzanensis]SBO94246.1 Polygalacturonase [Nonomuraea gerenzanensis]